MRPVDLGSILFGLAMLVLVVAYVMRPLAAGGQASQAGGQISSLQAEREHLLDALQELDLDHYMGKVLEKDYRPQRQALTQQGAQVLRRIDELQGPPGPQVSLEAELEAEVAKLRAVPQPSRQYCQQCGSRVLPSDRFCSNCGATQAELGG
ncbi:MAG: zinc ribbon domain-containing protein [Anaerolineales bacterium]